MPTASTAPQQRSLVPRRRSLVLPLAVLAVLVATLGVLCISLLSAARAYVGGESRWSRSQKAAAQHLLHYAESRQPQDWALYRAAIAVPLGDRQAREELDKPQPDLARVRAGFLAGANHPDDVPGMIRLYRWFGQMPFMQRAIATWAAGDVEIAALIDTAEAMHRAVEARADAAALLPLREQVRQIDARLTPLEAEFSATLGTAARFAHDLLVITVLLGAASLAGMTALVMQRAMRRDLNQAQALHDSEARFQRAMVGSSDGFWEWDIGRHRAYYSPRFETLLGLAPGTLPPQPDAARALLHPDDTAAARAALSAHLRQGQPYDITLRLRGADGQWRWVRSRAQVQQGPTADDLRLAGSIVDITERRQAELALRESETLFRSLWETTNDAVLIIGLDDLVRFANPAAHELFGHAPGTLQGQPLTVVQPQRMRAGHVAGVARYMRDGSRHLDWRGTEIMALHAQGHEFPMEIRFAQFELGGEPQFVGFLRDITQRKQAEQALHDARDQLEARVQARTRELSDANRRLLELDRLKSQFLATMSHELRTPLNSILGFTGILRRGMSGPLNAEQQRQLGFVHDSGKHLLALINDLLDLSRIESGRMEVARERFDFAEVAAEAAAQLRPTATGKALVLDVDVPAGLLLLGDRRKVYQVLLNLLGNAIKFTAQGRVAVTAQVAQAAQAAQADAGRLQVQVADTGIGIAPEHLSVLFEAFHQVDGSLGRNHEGTGLGLYLCRKLLELMGGDIGVSSQPGVGSTFRFSLPLEPVLPAEETQR